MLILLFTMGLITSHTQSIVHSLIYSFTAFPQRRQQSLLSCYSHELLKPPDMNNSAAENWGRTRVCVGGGWAHLA